VGWKGGATLSQPSFLFQPLLLHSSRWTFAEDCIRQFNGTPALKKIILAVLDPRDFMDAMVFDRKTQERKPANLQATL